MSARSVPRSQPWAESSHEPREQACDHEHPNTIRKVMLSVLPQASRPAGSLALLR